MREVKFTVWEVSNGPGGADLAHVASLAEVGWSSIGFASRLAD